MSRAKIACDCHPREWLSPGASFHWVRGLCRRIQSPGAWHMLWVTVPCVQIYYICTSPSMPPLSTQRSLACTRCSVNTCKGLERKLLLTLHWRETVSRTGSVSCPFCTPGQTTHQHTIDILNRKEMNTALLLPTAQRTGMWELPKPHQRYLHPLVQSYSAPSSGFTRIHHSQICPGMSLLTTSKVPHHHHMPKPHPDWLQV